jgi:hypothetical protein
MSSRWTSTARWVPQESNLPTPGFGRPLNPSQLETRRREARTRTPSACSQSTRAYPYATSRHVGTRGVEPRFS